jgi:uncharacterized membrane protein (UPF0127 family)
MNPMSVFRVFLSLVLCATLSNALIGCGASSPASTLPVVQMQIGGQPFNVEVATSDHDQEVGLMHRDSMPADHGMLFIFTDETARNFWNANVHFDLDLIFANHDGQIVSIKKLEKWSVKSVGSDYPAQYAIELNYGTADRLHLTAGAQLHIPATPK